MNNPIRAAFQKWYEAPLLLRMGGRTENMHVLDVGCGRGIGTEEILNRFGAHSVQAIDLDPGMVKKASKRLSAYGPRVTVSLGDIEHIDAKDATFDAVFDFAVLHHVPDWQNAVAEIRRVLKPGGRFFFQEVTTHALDKWSYRTFMDHPAENRFTARELISELQRQNISVDDRFVEKHSGDFVFGVGYRTEDYQILK